MPITFIHRRWLRFNEPPIRNACMISEKPLIGLHFIQIFFFNSIYPTEKRYSENKIELNQEFLY